MKSQQCLSKLENTGVQFLSSSMYYRNISYLRKNVRWVLVNRLIGLSLPRKSVVRLTDRPNITLAVDRGR